MDSMLTIPNNIEYLKFAKRVDRKHSHLQNEGREGGRERGKGSYVICEVMNILICFSVIISKCISKHQTVYILNINNFCLSIIFQ